MKAFSLPDEKRIRSLIGPELLIQFEEGWLDKAIAKVEKDLEESIRKIGKEVEMELREGRFLLPDFPVREARLKPVQGTVELDRERGILITDVPRGSYSVSYSVGFDDGEIPAVIQLAVERAAVLGIRCTEDDLEEYWNLVTVWLHTRAMRKKERDAIEADGKKSGQGFPWRKQG